MSLRQEHRDLVALARRIVQRHQGGRPDIAAELIARALVTGDADQTFALALALTEQALDSVEDSRLDAAEAGHDWRPAMYVSPTELVTPDDTSIAAVPLAIRLIDAMHRGMNGSADAVTELGAIYEQAACADDTVFPHVFAALATFAAHGRAETIAELRTPAASD